MTNAWIEAVQGYVQWADAYVKKAQSELNATTTKLEAPGGFTADDAVDAGMRMWMLLFNGMASLATEGMDAAATMAKYSATRTITSSPLSVGQPGEWTLAITSPLTNAKNVPLPASSVSIKPHHVQDGATEAFRVSVTVQEAPGGVYAGKVTATKPDGSASPIELDVTVQVG